ncbi:hypothetical protein [Rivibacter subsaxonicus]|uniref:Winged helix DNA-binding protein n=1 Tax=Rivibacter subsaxonicus TaxID=457575 RepID=A0A4Q7VWL3_9BURK|nr:hypothetical protein [Rivibacter subsaxonicus]RZU01111.1 hypothetical protein EV670_1826 [Rivibacter subsaxonicus]
MATAADRRLHGYSSRRERLRAALPGAVDQLRARRADLIGDGVIADYIALDWLRWRGSDLRLTALGSKVCRQLALSEPERLG